MGKVKDRQGIEKKQNTMALPDIAAPVQPGFFTPSGLTSLPNSTPVAQNTSPANQAGVVKNHIASDTKNTGNGEQSTPVASTFLVGVPPTNANSVSANGQIAGTVPTELSSVSYVRMLAPITTETVTLANGSTTTKVTDPHVAPVSVVTQGTATASSVVAVDKGVRHGEEPIRSFWEMGELTQSTSVPGLKFDFNDGLRVHVPEGDYRVVMVDMDDCLTLYDSKASDVTLCSLKKYFVRMRLEVWSGNKIVFAHEYDAKGKKVLIKFPGAPVLGDTLAWFPYAEEFRKKHQCEVYVVLSKELRGILERGYPELHFVTRDDEMEKQNKFPPELPKDIYATYQMGVFFPCDDRDHQPVDFRVMGLHRNAALILGLNEWEEHPPKLLPSEKEVAMRTIKDPYVCIAVNGSSQAKQWNNSRGWINVIKYLKKKGYRVLCIDKEDNHQVGSYTNQIPYGCEDFTGDKPLQERVDLIYHADFFIGVSSGLSWVAWGVGRPVILISGFTLPINEFTTPYRVISYHGCNGCWDDTRITFNHSDGEWCPRHKNTERQFECSRNITPERVCKVIDKCMADNGFNPEGGTKK